MSTSQRETLSTNLQSLQSEAEKRFAESTSSQDLYNWKVHYLGKAGEITNIMKKMGELPKEERPDFGKKVNEVKVALEKSYENVESTLKSGELKAKLAKETLDLTLPGTLRPRGTLHPVTRVTNEIVGIMARLGYSLRIGPMIEKDYYNFEALNIPADHPAREMQDTFFIDKTNVLRTHTSPIQIRTLESEELPLRIVGTGGVFRVDSDISHLPHFHQIEGMCVDHKISMADLKGTISFFVREFFGADLKTRFRPSFFPFTEPSTEVDCQCPICSGKGMNGSSPCSMCKQTGWIEIGGAGLINPRVLQMAKVNYPEWQGFAFGFGIERMAIIKYGVDDIRLFPGNDLRFLGQFDL